MNRVLDFFDDVRAFARREPVLTRAVVGYGVTLAASFGLDLDPEQILALLGLTTVGVSVLQRRKVTPDA